MKYCLVFVVLFLTKLGIVHLNENENQSDAEVIADCARELNVDVHKFELGVDLNEYLENPNNETTCMLACAMRKAVGVQGLSLHNGIVFMINDAYKKGFESKEFNKDDVLLKVNRCEDNEHGECEFFKCVNLFASPVLDVFVYDILNSITTAVIQSLFN